jgi:hypothetical protein
MITFTLELSLLPHEFCTVHITASFKQFVESKMTPGLSELELLLSICGLNVLPQELYLVSQTKPFINFRHTV